MVTTVTHRRIVGYIRVSTGKQAREDRSSLGTQEDRIRATASAVGGLVVKVFCDVESGRKDDRPQYRAMLEYISENDIDTVLVQYLDRFGRNPKEILSRIWQLGEQGVSVEATDQDIKDEMMLIVNAGMAGHESKRTSERVQANMNSSARKGVHSGPSPYGLRPVREIQDGKAVVVRWEVEVDEAEIVKEMARLSVEDNLGYKAIADSLNERGMTRNGRFWVPASIQLILRNPAIKGLLAFGRNRKKSSSNQELIEVPGVFPPILTETEWDLLQQRQDIRKGAPRGSVHRSEYLLSSIARCGHCGGPMTGKAGARRKDGTLYRSYQCVNAKKTRSKCAFHNSHSARKLEPAVLEYLGQFSDPKRVAELMDRSGPTKLKRIKKELGRAEKQLATLDRDFHQNLNLLKKGVLDEEEFGRANERRRDERASAEIRIAELRGQVEQAETAKESASSLPEKVKTFTESFEEIETPRAKAILQTILEAVYVWNDNRIEIAFRQ